MRPSAKKRILWIYDHDDLAKLPEWWEFRAKRVNAVVLIEHEDTGATSICLFDGDFEEGIIRCANSGLADAAMALLPPDLSPVTNLGGD